MKKSPIFTLAWKDFGKGLLLVVFTSVVQVIYSTVNAGSLNFDWPAIGKVAIIAAIGYLMKNLLTNSKDQFATKEPGS